jgi:D-glycero-D-manno-heptose 1,7-bisphosphate phosphatase
MGMDGTAGDGFVQRISGPVNQTLMSDQFSDDDYELQPAVFLDRDGVILETMIVNGLPKATHNLATTTLVFGAEDACADLINAGFKVIVVTNQPDIARGEADERIVDQIHTAIERALSIDGIYMCPHDDKDECECRKPKPGMLLQAAEEHGIDLERSFMVGDRWRDTGAGKAAGCRTVYIDHNYNERKPDDADHICKDLAQAISWILEQPN